MSPGEKALRKAIAAVREVAERVAADRDELTAAADDAQKALDQLLGGPPRLERPADEWVAALLAQAKAELRVARSAGTGRAEETLLETRMRFAVMAMLLQMAFEKIAKAVLARSDFDAFQHVRTSHAAASRMVGAIRQRARYRSTPFKRFNDDRWKVALGVITDLEAAHPALARGGPHLEYPWEQPDKVALPGTDLAVVARLASPRERISPDLLDLGEHLVDSFEQLFG
jgi:hypothetical protein